MKSNKFLRAFYIILALAANIGLDQFTKYLIRHKLEYYDRILFLRGNFYITRTENTGAFLGLGDSLGGGIKPILLNIFPLLAVLYGLYFILKRTDLNRSTLIGIILIVGGGIGNLIDRIAYGSVTDFLYINFKLFHTGIFNVADMSIMAGVGIILVQSFMQRKEGSVEAEKSKVSDNSDKSS